MQAALRILAQWAIHDPTLTLMAQGVNDVYRVEPGPYALRIQRCSLLDDATATSQLVWLEALAAEPDLVVPTPVPLLDGRRFVVCEDRRFVLLTWVEGESLLVLTRLEAAAAVGKTMARLHRQAAGWDPPAGFTCPQHGYGAPAADALALSRDDHAVLIEAARRVKGVMDEVGRGRESFGVVHGDLNFDNFVWHGGNARPIDFDEFGLGFFLSDIAEPLRVLVLADDYTDLRAALLAAYREERPLSAADEGRLDLFIAGGFLATLNWAARPESASRRHEIEPWIPRWIEAVARLAGLSGG